MSNNEKIYDPDKDIHHLSEECRQINEIDPTDFLRYGVKRGLRNADGSGVLAGITRVCNVHGYVISEGDKSPVDGKLTYRGIDIEELVTGFQTENRFGFEETAWLLLYGALPTQHRLELFTRALAKRRELPPSFVEDNILSSPSCNVMNALQRSVLSLYCYDDNPEEQSLENVLEQSISLIARMPTMMTAAYQAKRRTHDNKSMYMHQPKPELSTAENILRTLRPNKQFTDMEAKMLDLCMVLHAEHGGGNNSTFVARTITSSATDTYSAIAGAIGSLKGARHGGANWKVADMLDTIKANVKNWEDETEIASFLEKIINKQAGDGSGLVYGMGHAVYTLSDPRAILLKQYAEKMVSGTDYEKEYALINKVEKLTPGIFNQKKGTDHPLCANVDLYSGMVYTMLRIPPELITPLFASARTVGWCTHRIEEMLSSGSRIIRPAYKAMSPKTGYTPLLSR